MILKEEGKMKYPKYLALLSTLALLTPLSALARDQKQHSVNIFESLQIGSTTLTPGTYKVEWQGPGPAVQVEFLQYGKTVATAPATLKMNDKEVIQDGVVTDANGAKTKTLNPHYS